LKRLKCTTSMQVVRRINREVLDQHVVAQTLTTSDGGEFLWKYVAPDSW
jgi:hypothetical protein